MADPVLEQLRTLRCPEGSSAQVDLDTNQAVCLTPTGQIVEPIAAKSGLTGSKVIAWSVGVSALLIMGAFYYSSSGRRSW